MNIQKALSQENTRVLRLRLKDKHATWLRMLAAEVNLVWNFDNELSFKVWERERRFMTAFDLHKYTQGATKEGLSLHSQTVQAINEEFVTRRKQFKKVKLRWRVSNRKRSNYSLGWVPFKASAIVYRNGQVWFGGRPLSLWDSYGLKNYRLGPGSFSEDARGRWYLNVTVKVPKKPLVRVPLSSVALGIDLGLKHLISATDGTQVEAPQLYRELEQTIAIAQRAGKKGRVRALHAKVRHRRADLLHKLSTAQVRRYCAIFVGDVDAQALTQTHMAKSVLDAGWGTYRTMLQYKSDDAGVWFKVVDERYSTQTCHCCGERTGPKGKQGLEVRCWTCSSCGTQHDRDGNASENIRRLGLAWLEKEYAAAEGRAPEPDFPVNEVRLARIAVGRGRLDGGTPSCHGLGISALPASAAVRQH